MTRDEAFEKFWNTEIVSSVTGKVDVPMWGDIDRNDTAYIFMAGYNACKEALEQPAQEYDVNELIDKITPENLQEPVAWMDENNYVFEKSSDIDDSGEKTPLYTHPAQPLNDDEICKIYEDIRWDIRGTDIVIDFARAIEQAHNIGVKDEH